MELLIEIMRKSSGYPVVCWWANPFWDAVITAAASLRFVYRPSTSQVEWTERGAELAKKYGRSTRACTLAE